MSKVRILSLDGGGIRGIIPATIIKHVEEKIIEFTENPNARIADYFDFIAGTSTGGILSCFYLVPNNGQNPNEPKSKYKAEEALDFYVQHGYEIFNKSKRNPWLGLRQLFNATKYRPNNLEKIFQDVFENLKISELRLPCIITAYDLKNKMPFFFSSVEKPEKQRDFFVKDVARSTSAAPTYFPPAPIRNIITDEEMINIDGGVFANNPVMCAYAECRDSDELHIKHPKAKDMQILSIGTGGSHYDLPSLKGNERWGVINWAKSIPDIMMDGSIDTVAYQMKHLIHTLDKKDRINYKRIDVPEKSRNYSLNMADASQPNIEKLKIAADETLKETIKDQDDMLGLDKFIELLIENSPEKVSE